jgi:hypothetical protein
MKNVLFLTALIFCTSCKKDIYQAPTISGITGDTIVMNIGDKMVLAPNITNTKGNNYTWLVNGKQSASGEINYTFEATYAGNFDITFKVNNKGGTDEQSFKVFVEKLITISIDDLPAIPMCRVVDITPSITGPERTDYEYQWSIGDSVISKQLNLSFIAIKPGDYNLTLRTTAGKQTTSITRKITVQEAQYVRNAYTLLEYSPAPAKGHNWSIIGYAELWKYGSEFPLAYNDFLTKATEQRKVNEGDALVLGSWGGSATFKFDHTVANFPGQTDIELTATFSKLDPPAVYVAYDRNRNGLPDIDEWYELKNEDYGIEDLPEYTMTFTYLKTETDNKRIYTYFNWKDNQLEPATGEVMNVKTFSSSTTTTGTFSTKGFFPGFNMIDIPTKQVAIMDGWKESFTLKGKRITRNLTGAPPFIQKRNLDIDLAVNSKGETVQLPGIDFIKIQKVIYPFQQDFINAGGAMKDFNMEEERMLHVGSILDLHLKN